MQFQECVPSSDYCTNYASSASAFSEALGPVTWFVPKKWRPSGLLDGVLDRVYCTQSQYIVSFKILFARFFSLLNAVVLPYAGIQLLHSSNCFLHFLSIILNSPHVHEWPSTSATQCLPDMREHRPLKCREQHKPAFVILWGLSCAVSDMLVVSGTIDIIGDSYEVHLPFTNF